MKNIIFLCLINLCWVLSVDYVIAGQQTVNISWEKEHIDVVGHELCYGEKSMAYTCVNLPAESLSATMDMNYSFDKEYGFTLRSISSTGYKDSFKKINYEIVIKLDDGQLLQMSHPTMN